MNQLTVDIKRPPMHRDVAPPVCIVVLPLRKPDQEKEEAAINIDRRNDSLSTDDHMVKKVQRRRLWAEDCRFVATVRDGAL
jgi:hypothetical protein